MDIDVLTTVVSTGVLLAAPIIWAAFGEAILERSGVLNIGIEGVMLFGAFAAAFGVDRSGFALGFVLAVLSGMLVGGLLAWLWVRRGVDQVVSGIMLNFFAIGVTTLLWQEFLQELRVVNTLPTIEVPLLADLPLIGDILFQQNAAVFALLPTGFLLWLVLYRTWFGLRVRAVGEAPSSAAASGVSVRRTRAAAIVLGCGLVAVGGATLVASSSGSFNPGITGGLGFVALAIVVVGRWTPLGIALAGLLVGVVTAMQFQGQSIEVVAELPSEFWAALPYLVTLGALALARHARYPSAIAASYEGP